jgi:hypothetical protein
VPAAEVTPIARSRLSCVSRQARMMPKPLQMRAPTWLSRVPSAMARIVFARPFVT